MKFLKNTATKTQSHQGTQREYIIEPLVSWCLSGKMQGDKNETL
jgi:hypothetical protein